MTNIIQKMISITGILIFFSLYSLPSFAKTRSSKIIFSNYICSMKSVLYICIFVLLAQASSAQRRGYENMNDLFRNKNKLAHKIVLDLGYGHSFLQAVQYKKDLKNLGEQYFNKQGYQFGVIHAKAELRFHKRFGVEFKSGFSWNKFESLKFSTVSPGSILKSTYSYDYKTSFQRYTFKFNWHSLSDQRFWDFYISPGVGFTIRKMKFSTTDPKLANDAVWDETIVPPVMELNYSLNFTSRIWLYRHLGIFLELGTGIDHSGKIYAYQDEIQLGISLRP